MLLFGKRHLKPKSLFPLKSQININKVHMVLCCGALWKSGISGNACAIKEICDLFKSMYFNYCTF